MFLDYMRDMGYSCVQQVFVGNSHLVLLTAGIYWVVATHLRCILGIHILLIAGICRAITTFVKISSTFDFPACSRYFKVVATCDYALFVWFPLQIAGISRVVTTLVLCSYWSAGLQIAGICQVDITVLR